MDAWLLGYANSFVRSDKLLFDYLVTKKDSRIWIGSVEALLALCLVRFRSQAKIRLKKGFRVGNDHSHPFKIGEYSFNLQGIKRAVLGGSSNDLLNFKGPIFFVNRIVDQLRPENKEIILRIARESIQSLIDTYKKDILAVETLQSLDMILRTMQNDGDLDNLKEYLYVNDDYLASPLTQKNMELWGDNLDLLNKICVLYRNAHTDVREGRNPEANLDEIKHLQEGIREKLQEYLLEIPKGH